ncbi:glutamyl-tRNA reductase [Desulfonema ishimotonii]|uniref:Glutamyl-tRNA reductase n=1 Tax=Desulfonema ishimotonii TaxID=45657 RepID=A0A401G1W2_9BACT|nr:glutamyl-tRNA reductase [Desulfonema ishimotonii]GBC63186.1 glutamyl-tRNA reductase [Desulfonema ishimotonii]
MVSQAVRSGKTGEKKYNNPEQSNINQMKRSDVVENREENVCRMKRAPVPENCRTDIVLLGLNHKTAEVELRECLGFSKDEADDALQAFRDSPAIAEVVLLSTCNRVELLMAAHDADQAVATAKAYLSATKHLPVSQFEEALYVHTGDEAVRHIFRVAASLDSMVVGEPQILGQLKDAYYTATLRRTSGVVLNRLLHKTFFVAKRVRTETGIGDRAVSISYAATELGRKIFGTLEEKKVLLIGAGEMAELAVEHLIQHRAGDILVANRTFERGLEMAGRFNGQAVRFEEIPDCLRAVDIIISSTGSPDFILTKDQVRKVMRARKNRPLFFIDIAVPRDIDPAINRIANTYVYDIDDLRDVIEENIEDRNREALRAGRIIDEGVIRFRQWYDSLDVVPTIVALREKLWGIAETEIRKSLGHSLSHLSPEEGQAIRRMTTAMINKMLHDPTIFLKKNGCHSGKTAYLDATRKLFKLDDEEGVLL